jgi:hypothetical protein
VRNKRARPAFATSSLWRGKSTHARVSSREFSASGERARRTRTCDEQHLDADEQKRGCQGRNRRRPRHRANQHVRHCASVRPTPKLSCDPHNTGCERPRHVRCGPRRAGGQSGRKRSARQTGCPGQTATVRAAALRSPCYAVVSFSALLGGVQNLVLMALASRLAMLAKRALDKVTLSLPVGLPTKGSTLPSGGVPPGHLPSGRGRVACRVRTLPGS